jgi:hypothetical protein
MSPDVDQFGHLTMLAAENLKLFRGLHPSADSLIDRLQAPLPLLNIYSLIFISLFQLRMTGFLRTARCWSFTRFITMVEGGLPASQLRLG